MKKLFQKRSVTLLFLVSKPPFFVGVYEGKKLIDSVEFSGKTSDILPLVIEQLDHKYEIRELIYTSAPGNQMSIKTAYVCLQSLSIIRRVELRAAFAFEFNGFKPIEFVNKRFFCFENDTISIKYLPDEDEGAILLPEHLDNIKFQKECEPFYVMPPA